jgi:DNA-binding response OmpR family regulator
MSTGEIAVIDDNRQWLDAVAETLTDEGYRVHTATNGQQASVLLTSTLPGLVILDVKLPGTSGLKILADFRRRDNRTPVLMTSSEDRASVHEQAMANGANGFLRKPFSPSVLLSAVRRFLEPARACVA